LTAESQRRWGNVERFGNAHRDGAMKALRGVNVLAVRHLENWVDPELGLEHEAVAELDVEYTFASGEQKATVKRTVHLVGVDGRWKSLSYPH